MTEVPPIQPAPATPLDIYIRQMEIGVTLGGMHEQLKAVPDHEQRVRRLEASQTKLIGAAMARVRYRERPWDVDLAGCRAPLVTLGC